MTVLSTNILLYFVSVGFPYNFDTPAFPYFLAINFRLHLRTKANDRLAFKEKIVYIGEIHLHP